MFSRCAQPRPTWTATVSPAKEDSVMRRKNACFYVVVVVAAVASLELGTPCVCVGANLRYYALMLPR